MKIKCLLVFILSVLFVLNTFAQPVVQINSEDWTSSSSNGPCACSVDFNNGSELNFFDTGGSGNYSANENEEITLCPDASGSKMRVALFEDPAAGYSLNIHPSDTLYVYDGTTTSSPVLAKINDDTYINGVNIPASWSNQSGCLTFQFISDDSNEGTGWGGNLSCANLVQPFSNHITATVNGLSNGANDNLNDLNPIDTGYVDICLGDVITFNAEPYFPYEPGGDSAALSGGGYMQSNNYSVTWEISDGSVYTTSSFEFTPTVRNGFFITLKVEDANGQFKYSSCKVRVSTLPSFSTCGPVTSPICLGRTVNLVGGITSVDTAGVDPVSTNFPIGGVFGEQTYLPDGSGFNYTTEIDISGFTDGVTIQNPSDIDQLCVKIEHSYLGDLEMMLTCPNGQSVNIFNSYSGFGTSGELYPGGFSGGNDFLGGAYDNNTGNIGYCEEYCFSDSSIAMNSWADGYITTVATGPSTGDMIVPGLYKPEESFIPALQGCPVNGEWVLTVRDNIGIDDGFICEWGIYFNDLLNPDREIYSPSIVDNFWQSDPTIIEDLDTVVLVEPANVGANFYTFVVEDEYGCFYDTTVIAQTIQGGNIIDDTITCEDFFQYSDNYLTPLGGYWIFSSGDGEVEFDDTTIANPYLTFSNPGIYTMGLKDEFCNDTIYNTVAFLTIPDSKFFPTDSVCLGDELQIVVSNDNPYNTFSWTDLSGDSLASGDSLFINSLDYFEGYNDIYLNVSNACGESQGLNNFYVEACELPNIITPNNDGINDFFSTKFAVVYSDVNLTVLNRWGSKVYSKDNYDNSWNGVDNNGNKLKNGNYYYVLTYNNGENNLQGIVKIIDSSN
jgi:gliding motility-associated-like protein